MKKRPRWMSLAGQGFELTAAVIGFGAVGYWVGGQFGDARIGLTIGAILGIIGGLYNLIKASLKAVKRSEATLKRSRQDQSADQVGKTES